MVFFIICCYRKETFIHFFKISSYNTIQQQISQDLVTWMLLWKLVLVVGISYCYRMLLWQLLKGHCYSNGLTFPEKKYFWFLQQCEILPNLIIFFKNKLFFLKKKKKYSKQWTTKDQELQLEHFENLSPWEIMCKIPEDENSFFLILFSEWLTIFSSCLSKLVNHLEHKRGVMSLKLLCSGFDQKEIHKITLLS